MNIAVIIEERIHTGGGFQHSLSAISLLNKKKDERYNFIFFTTVKENVGIFNENGIEALYLNVSAFDKMSHYIRRSELISRAIRRFNIAKAVNFDRILKKHGVDLIFFPSPSFLALVTQEFNYFFTVLDLCHRDFVEFPEVNVHQEFEMREEHYKKAVPKAVKVIALSDLGKKDIIRRYNIDEGRVVSLPMLASSQSMISESEYEKNYIDIKKKYRIKGNYVFYPAQFWPHKNHRYILDALKILKEEYNKKINAVFCGSDMGNLHFILTKAAEYGIGDQIFYIGFVDGKEIPYLYRQSMALTMPTYFGPTNIPPIEAFSLGCPVCYSNLPGLREQVGDAAFLMDLKNPRSLVEILLNIEKDKTAVNEKIENGKRLLKKWTEQDFWNVFKELLDEYEIVLKCWKY